MKYFIIEINNQCESDEDEGFSWLFLEGQEIKINTVLKDLDSNYESSDATDIYNETQENENLNNESIEQSESKEIAHKGTSQLKLYTFGGSSSISTKLQN